MGVNFNQGPFGGHHVGIYVHQPLFRGFQPLKFTAISIPRSESNGSASHDSHDALRSTERPGLAISAHRRGHAHLRDQGLPHLAAKSPSLPPHPVFVFFLPPKHLSVFPQEKTNVALGGLQPVFRLPLFGRPQEPGWTGSPAMGVFPPPNPSWIYV